MKSKMPSEITLKKAGALPPVDERLDDGLDEGLDEGQAVRDVEVLSEAPSIDTTRVDRPPRSVPLKAILLGCFTLNVVLTLCFVIWTTQTGKTCGDINDTIETFSKLTNFSITFTFCDLDDPNGQRMW